MDKEKKLLTIKVKKKKKMHVASACALDFKYLVECMLIENVVEVATLVPFLSSQHQMTPNTWTMKLLAYIHLGKSFSWIFQ